MKLWQLKRKKENAIKKENYELACNIKDDEMKLINEKEKIEMNILKKKKIKRVSIYDVRDVISKKTGIPIICEETKIFNEINNLEKKLKSNIIGQEKAIDSLIEISKKIKLGIKPNNKSYSLLFSGSSGVGKTNLAKKFASSMTNNVIKLDMNEYSLKESINKLIGSPAGYIGYDEENMLENIRNHPYSVLILDEIEKAHNSVINFFLNILDEGYCFDNKGNKIRFDNVIIIMTTNAVVSKNSLGFNNKSKNVFNEFPKEFINRIDEVIEFNDLNENDINTIIFNEVLKYNKRNKTNIKLSLEEINNIKDKSNYEIYGARKLSRIIKKELDNKLILSIFN